MAQGAGRGRLKLPAPHKDAHQPAQEFPLIRSFDAGGGCVQEGPSTNAGVPEESAQTASQITKGEARELISKSLPVPDDVLRSSSASLYQVAIKHRQQRQAVSSLDAVPLCGVPSPVCPVLTVQQASGELLALLPALWQNEVQQRQTDKLPASLVCSALQDRCSVCLLASLPVSISHPGWHHTAQFPGGCICPVLDTLCLQGLS